MQSALQNLMTGRTVFVIAHRLSTVRRADRIVVLENGTIEDIGPHEELMREAGTYRRLYDLQFVEVETSQARMRCGSTSKPGVSARMPGYAQVETMR